MSSLVGVTKDSATLQHDVHTRGLGENQREHTECDEHSLYVFVQILAGRPAGGDDLAVGPRGEASAR